MRECRGRISARRQIILFREVCCFPRPFQAHNTLNWIINKSFSILSNFWLKNQYDWASSTNLGADNCPNCRMSWFTHTLVPYCGIWPRSTARQLPIIPFEFFMYEYVVVLFVLMKCLCVGTGEPGGAGLGAWEGSWGWAEDRTARAAGTDAAPATARQGKCHKNAFFEYPRILFVISYNVYLAHTLYM